MRWQSFGWADAAQPPAQPPRCGQAAVSVKRRAPLRRARGELWRMCRSLRWSVAPSRGSEHRALVLFLRSEMLESGVSFKTRDANA